MAEEQSVLELLLQARDESSEAFTRLREHLDGVHEGVSRIKEMGLGVLFGGLGVGMIQGVVGGIDEFGRSLLATNSAAESARQTLTALYGTAAQAQQALDWMTQFAASVPFTKASIVEAGVSIASMGQNITQVLPALGNVAAVMGATMPQAAEAFVNAMHGRFMMMQNDLHISKQELVDFGMEMDKSGHVTNVESMVAAFEKLSRTRFGDGMTLQMHTMAGAMSNVQDAWEEFTKTLGEGIFSQVEGQLFNLTQWLAANKAQVHQFATEVGSALAAVAQGVFSAAQVLVSVLPSAINFVANTWQFLSRGVEVALGIVSKVISTFTTWFGSTAAPVIYEVIGQIAMWWQEHGASVVKSLQYIWGEIQRFANLVVTGLRMAWDYIQADVKLLWDQLQTAFTVGGDLLSGNWSKAGQDMITGTKRIAADLIKLFGLMFNDLDTLGTDALMFVPHAIADMIPALAGPLQGMVDAFNKMWGDIRSPVSGVVGFIVGAVTTLVDGVKAAINVLMHSIQAAIDSIPSRIDLPFGKHADIPGVKGLQDLVNRWKPLDLVNPLTAGTDASKAIAASAGIGGGKPLDFTAISKNANSLIDSVQKGLQAPGNFVKDMTDKLAAWIDPGGTGGKQTTDAAKKLGKELVRNLFGDFPGLIGAITGGNALGAFGGPGAPMSVGTPNLAMTGGAGGAAGAATGGGVGAQVATYLFNTMQNLGALTASFGGSRITPGGGGAQDQTAAALARQLAVTQDQLALAKTELAQATTRENLLRQQLREAELSRGYLQVLAQSASGSVPTRTPLIGRIGLPATGGV